MSETNDKKWSASLKPYKNRMEYLKERDKEQAKLAKKIGPSKAAAWMAEHWAEADKKWGGVA